MVLHQGRRTTGQDRGSDGEAFFHTEPAVAETDHAATGQSQQQLQLDVQPTQAAAAATAEGQIARLPAMQQPQPANETWWHAMHANFTASVKVSVLGSLLLLG
jgi:hypothetical protein